MEADDFVCFICLYLCLFVELQLLIYDDTHVILLCCCLHRPICHIIFIAWVSSTEVQHITFPHVTFHLPQSCPVIQVIQLVNEILV